MGEIYKSAQNKAVMLGVTSASGVSAKIIRGTTVLTALVASTSSDYAASIPYAITNSEGPFSVEWTYTVESNVYVRTDSHEIVSPLLPLASLNSAEKIEVEQAVRYFIEAYTNNWFGSFSGKLAFEGTGHDTVELPRRLRSMTEISINGVVQSLANFVVTGDGMFLNRTSPANYEIRQAPPDDIIIYPNNVIVAPSVSPVRGFADNSLIEITGLWGYEQVPQDVMLAADLLFNDYMCADAAYRNRFVNSIRAGNWRFDLRDDAFAGTGNLTADRLLDKYRIDPMVVI